MTKMTPAERTLKETLNDKNIHVSSSTIPKGYAGQLKAFNRVMPGGVCGEEFTKEALEIISTGKTSKQMEEYRQKMDAIVTALIIILSAAAGMIIDYLVVSSK